MTDLTIPDELWRTIRLHLLEDPNLERAAVAFAGIAGNQKDLLLREWEPVREDEYLAQLSYHLEVSPTVWARAAKRSRRSGEAVIILHSHPNDPRKPRFSTSDDAGEKELVPKLQGRSNVPIGAVVVSPAGLEARVHSAGTRTRPLQVKVIGRSELSPRGGPAEDRFARQALALGSAGQKRLSQMTVGVVGAGGLGSHVVQQLAHLGVGQLVVADFDDVSESNLSRLVGGRRWDARFYRSKTSVARRLVRQIGGPTKCEVVPGRLQDRGVARRLIRCDFVFGCTDNQWSRSVLNTIAFQYYVPTIDLGVELQVNGAMGGRVSLLRPSGPCLWCMGVLSHERVRAEQLPQEAREQEVARGYIQGIDEPAPAVISINGAIASLGVTEFLAYTTHFAQEPRPLLLVYRISDGSVRRTAPAQEPNCYTCSNKGILGAGDLAPSPWD